MTIRVSETINASPERIWQVITDFDRAAEHIEQIISAQVLTRPAEGLIGLSWKETRKVFGKEAEETMTIEKAETGRFYQTYAENHGTIYRSRMEIKPLENGCELSMSFDHEPQSFGARLMSVFAFLFSGSLKKMMAQDLQDVKKICES